MDKPFFVMMYSQSGNTAMPIMADMEMEEVAFYATEQEARDMADNHGFASKFGYEIFEMGTGE
jgi:hypothetical protein